MATHAHRSGQMTFLLHNGFDSLPVMTSGMGTHSDCSDWSQNPKGWARAGHHDVGRDPIADSFVLYSAPHFELAKTTSKEVSD